MLVQISRECTPPNLSSGISNLRQPAQAEVVLGQRSTYLASWAKYMENWPNTTSAWAGWRRFDIPVDRSDHRVTRVLALSAF